MKKILSVLLILIVIIGCFSVEHTNNGQTVIVNPASKYCVRKGGESIIRTNENGNRYGVCRFKDKTEVNEWEYYRNSKASSKSGELQIKFGFGIK